MVDAVARSSFRRALDAFFDGIGFVLSTPRVWPYAAVPALVTLILWTLFAGLGIWGATELSAVMLGPRRGGWWEAAYWTLTVLFSALGMLLAALVALKMAQPLSGPALERISIAQQRRLTGAEPSSTGLLRSVWVSLQAVAVAVALGWPALIALFVIDLLFPPAAVVTVPLKFLVGAWMLAWDCFDYPLGIRGLGVGERVRWVRRHIGEFTWFGLFWVGLTVVPGVALLLLPMGAAGATRLVLEDDPRTCHDERDL